ncbi:MAG: hypothetical protein IKF97_07235 [Clostridia bacterium]|nr:hypothetical protein [Clostridia bacterium]
MASFVTSDIIFERGSIKNVRKQLIELNVNIPNDFVEKVIENGYAGPISTTDVSEIMKIARFWKPYITEDSYDGLIIWMVMRIFKIHTFAINSNQNSGFFIGNRAKRNDTPMMRELVTTVLSTGGKASFVDTPSKFKFE